MSAFIKEDESTNLLLTEEEKQALGLNNTDTATKEATEEVKKQEENAKESEAEELSFTEEELKQIKDFIKTHKLSPSVLLNDYINTKNEYEKLKKHIEEKTVEKETYEITDEIKQKAIENFRNEFDNDPISVVLKIVDLRMKQYLTPIYNAYTQEVYTQSIDSIIKEAETNWQGFKENERQIAEELTKPEYQPLVKSNNIELQKFALKTAYERVSGYTNKNIPYVARSRNVTERSEDQVKKTPEDIIKDSILNVGKSPDWRKFFGY